MRQGKCRANVRMVPGIGWLAVGIMAPAKLSAEVRSVEAPNPYEAPRIRVGRVLTAPAPESDEREDWETLYKRVTGQDPTLCAECGHGYLHKVRKLPALARRPPP